MVVRWFGLLGVMVMSSIVAAFDPPVAKVDDITLRIDAPQIIPQLETPIPVRVHLSNAGSQSLRGRVRLQVIDRWRITSPNPQPFELPPKSERVLEFTVIAGTGTHNAHYPIHAFAEWGEAKERKVAHAILVVEVRAPRQPKPTKKPTVSLRGRGSMPLWQTGNQQVSFQLLKPKTSSLQQFPIGWWGTDEATGAHAMVAQRVDRGGIRDALAIHPPWRKGAGTIFVDWQVSLPKATPIWLDFAFAIRDHDPQREPPSDGVTVRIWVKGEGETEQRTSKTTQQRKSSKTPTSRFASFDPPDQPTAGAGRDDGWELLYERHSDSKTWVPALVDLSAFAEQTITLRIEVHPGPRLDTTCDLAYLAEPYLVVGRKPPEQTTEQALKTQTLQLIAWARWQIAEAAQQWGLLPKDRATQQLLATLRRLVPTATEPQMLQKADTLAQQLLKRLSIPKANRTLFVPPRGSQPAVWVIAHDNEIYAFTLQPPKGDGWWNALGAIVSPERTLIFQGFDLRVLGDNLKDWRSPSVLLSRTEQTVDNRLVAVHQMERHGVPYNLRMIVWTDEGTLKVQWQLTTTAPQDKHQPIRITDCAIGSWSETADRIYLGHGNVVVHPSAFRLHADGHFLSTRHVGMEFVNGLSVVIGVNNPPDFFECQPQVRHYSIHTHMDTTFTIAPSVRSIWQAAKRYRTVDPYKPVPTLPKVAGRFVFDLWGGWRYAWVAEQLARSFRYGCTDALVIYHNWQRWGYDYRLPDIFPPNPAYGTLDDFRKMVEICNRYGVLFAPHDNYIDFYPDAEGYSYRHICFTPDGNPIRAWFNEWRQAQSYRWRPDAFFPFMERNLRLIAEHIKPTAYFVDVFSSIGMFDWWTEDGEFHSILETQRRWGESFDFIRRILKGAPQISESGCDWLINWLDGATTNHLRVEQDPSIGRWSVWRVRCEDAERVPWFDFAHHHKFALHGAGYSDRYQGGLPYEEAGIYSDDYICTEVLTGHPAMVSEPFGPQVVRKYWLLAELSRTLALVPMSEVTFAKQQSGKDDIHRQIVRYENGATVWVNRSRHDWAVNGRTLPPFGFYAVVKSSGKAKSFSQSNDEPKQLEAAIERLPTTDGDSVIAEWTLSDRFAYCNARTKPLFGWTRIWLRSAKVRWLGDRRFELTLHWYAEEPTDESYLIFVHFTHPNSRRGEQIAFQGDHTPPVPTNQWQGEVETRTVVTVPKEWGADRYGIRIGLWHPTLQRRLRLAGDLDETMRLKVGELVLEGTGEAVTGAQVVLNPKLSELPAWLKRWNTQGKAVNFGFAITDGAFRFDRQTLTLIPLPDHPPFNVTLRLVKLAPKVKRITQVEAIDENGKVIGAVPFTQHNGEVTFRTQPKAFAYRLRL